MPTAGPSASTPGPGAVAATIGAAAGYLLLVHLLLVSDVLPVLSLATVVAPWVIAGLSGLWSTDRLGSSAVRAALMAAALIALGSIAWRYGDRLAAHADAVLYLENLAFLTMLAGLFAATLRDGQEPLVTGLARRARDGDMPPRVVRYTRAVTLGWSLFFVAAALSSCALFFTQSRAVWSSFVNLALGPLVVVAFVAEYGIRLRVLRGLEHGTLMTGVMAYAGRDRGETGGRS